MRPRLFSLIALAGSLAWLAALSGEDAAPPPVPKLLLQEQGAATAYHAAYIYTATAKDALSDAYLVVQAGKVAGVVEADDLPPLIPVVELGDVSLMPGLVAADSTVTGGSGQGDRSLAAHLKAADAFDPWMDTSKILEHGITTFYLSPDRRRLIGGRGAVVKAGGAHRVLAAAGDLRVNLTTEAWNPPDYFRPPIPPTTENPLLPAQAQAPNARPGALLALRQAHEEALQRGERNPNAQGLRDFLRSDAALRLVVDDADQAMVALQLAQSWERQPVLQGLTQADRDQLAAVLQQHHATLLFAVPLFASMPELDLNWEFPPADMLATLAPLAPIALQVSHHGRWTWLLEAAAAATGYGLSEEEAIAGITTVPAKVLGVERRVGKLAPGLDADFVVLDGLPLDPAASVQRVFIEGDEVWNRNQIEALHGDAVVVRAGTLWTGDGPPLEGGVEVLLENGKIVAAGHVVPHPAGARLVDAGSQAHITPGFIDARGYLGLQGVRSVSSRIDLGRLADGSFFSDLWRPIAQSGVTSMVLGPRRLSSQGARASIVKTAALDHAFLADRYVVFFDARASDHAANRSALENQLKKGKAYFDKWEKYRKERAEWEKEHQTKSATERLQREKELRLRLAQGSAAKVEEEVVEEEEEASTEEEVEEEKPVDPINGLWEGTLEHEMLPEPVTLQARLHHEGKELTGIFSAAEFPGDELELEGSFENNAVHFEIPTQMGNVNIDGTLDAPDSMSVKIELAGFGSAEFTMARIEVEEEGAAPISKKRRKKEDGPAEPDKDWNLEGMRALFDGRARAVVAASRKDEIEHVLDAFQQYQLPVQLMYADDAVELSTRLQTQGVGVVVSAAVTQRQQQVDVVPAAKLRAAGIPVAFQSDSTLGARFLPHLLTMATRYGLGAEQALAGLTAEAADMLGVADRIGRVRSGLDGDLVVFSGPPFDLRSHVRFVFVNGREVPQP